MLCEGVVDFQELRVLRVTRGQMSAPSIRPLLDATMQILELRRRAHKDGNAFLREFLQLQSSIQHQMPNRRRMLPEHSKTCERVHLPKRTTNHGLPLPLHHHGLNLPDNVKKPHLAHERQASILGQQGAMNHPYQVATTARDLLRNDMRSDLALTFHNKNHLLFPNGRLQLLCLIR
jgi:hypothetical protein